METNLLAILVAAISALFVGFFWYHPKVFGNAWMQSAGVTEEQLKSGSMAKIFILALIFSFLLYFAMQFLVIHQTGVLGVIGGDTTKALPSYTAYMAD